ncbi:M67 family metallopeptidase [Paenibacillus sp. sgz302251]|uniref:M67 family metallopeptidase n=1 Tax=Paenibacillus sp. sgz302251 TaxID=3414493 RepID=UPI003C7D78B8
MEIQQTNSFITKNAYDRLLQICLEAKPIEACGILASNQSPSAATAGSSQAPVIDTIIPITNTHINPTYAFSFDPAEWTAVYYEMQKNRQTLVGLFHSHPRTDAVPSTDDTEGFLPASGLSYWIISLKNSESPDVRPYRLVSGSFIPIELVIA